VCDSHLIDGLIHDLNNDSTSNKNTYKHHTIRRRRKKREEKRKEKKREEKIQVSEGGEVNKKRAEQNKTKKQNGTESPQSAQVHAKRAGRGPRLLARGYPPAETWLRAGTPQVRASLARLFAGR
jgi:hypothetical protein